MDLQEMLNNSMAAHRAEELKGSQIMTLGEAIAVLEHSQLIYTDFEGKENDKNVVFDFGCMSPAGLESWRGIYAELAICYSEDDTPPTAKEFLKELKEAVGKTYEGYKGGDFTMGKATPLHVDNHGHSSRTALVAIEVCDYDILLRTWNLEV